MEMEKMKTYDRALLFCCYDEDRDHHLDLEDFSDLLKARHPTPTVRFCRVLSVPYF